METKQTFATPSLITSETDDVNLLFAALFQIGLASGYLDIIHLAQTRIHIFGTAKAVDTTMIKATKVPLEDVSKVREPVIRSIMLNKSTAA